MKKIYKYPFDITDVQKIGIPVNHDVVRVGLDPSGTPCIWAKVNPEEIDIEKEVYVFETGHDIPDQKTHVGSFIQNEFVWHLFY